MTNRLLLAACATLALGSFGCSNTVRYMTATHWITPPGGANESAPAPAPAAPAPAEPPAGEGAEAAPAPAAEPAPAPAPASAPAGAGPRVLYVTYWEGSCSGGFIGIGRGCSKGNSHVKRCTVQADNSLACVDEQDIDKALSTGD